jgi:hypothetical protein
MSALSVLAVLIQSLIKLIWKPKQYVDLTVSGIPKGLYDIIIIGGGMLPSVLKNVIKLKNVGPFG